MEKRERIQQDVLENSRAAAYLAISEAIIKNAEGIEKSNATPYIKADALMETALAYRYLVGGTQPGSVVVKK